MKLWMGVLPLLAAVLLGASGLPAQADTDGKRYDFEGTLQEIWCVGDSTGCIVCASVRMLTGQTFTGWLVGTNGSSAVYPRTEVKGQVFISHVGGRDITVFDNIHPKQLAQPSALPAYPVPDDDAFHPFEGTVTGMWLENDAKEILRCISIRCSGFTFKGIVTVETKLNGQVRVGSKVSGQLFNVNIGRRVVTAVNTLITR